MRKVALKGKGRVTAQKLERWTGQRDFIAAI